MGIQGAVIVAAAWMSWVPLGAAAQWDGIGLGNGQDGDLVGGFVGNVSQQVDSLDASGNVMVRDSSPFEVGQVVLVWQTVVVDPPIPVVDAPADAGRLHLGRIVSVGPTSLRLEPPVPWTLRAGAQIVIVPQFDQVLIPVGDAFGARPFDGSGGVVAFLARDRVEIQGQIDVDAAGFRGGPDAFAAETTTCDELMEPILDAPRGEGIVHLSDPGCPGISGCAPDPLLNGGGGGQTPGGGGGGGANAGPGGRGEDECGMTRWGEGGRPLNVLPGEVFSTAFFGGGGGASGHTTGFPDPSRAGGDGGGLVFFRAASLRGTGQITADGVAAPEVSGVARGGGGAGGTVLIQLRDEWEMMASCVTVHAAGGASTFGGGGGGGRIVVGSGPGSACAAADSGHVGPGVGANPGDAGRIADERPLDCGANIDCLSCRDGGTCAAGTACDLATGACVPSCTADAECSAGICTTAMYCDPLGCRTDAPCDAGLQCVIPTGRTEGRCVSPCADDVECPAGQLCGPSGVCEPATVCDCLPAERCDRGVCVPDGTAAPLLFFAGGGGCATGGKPLRTGLGLAVLVLLLGWRLRFRSASARRRRRATRRRAASARRRRRDRPGAP